VAPDGFAPLRECFRTIQGHEIWRLYGGWIGLHRPALGPGVQERLAYASRISAEETDSARAILASVRGELRRLIEPGTVMALPTVPCIAPLLDTPAAALDKVRTRVMTLTCIAGLGGLPQVTLPVGLVEGCPVGLSFIGWVGGDEMLLDLAVKLAPYCGG
jgi:amidase